MKTSLNEPNRRKSRKPNVIYVKWQNFFQNKINIIPEKTVHFDRKIQIKGLNYTRLLCHQ